MNQIEQTGEFVVSGTAAGLVEQMPTPVSTFRQGSVRSSRAGGTAAGPELLAAPEYTSATIVTLSGTRGDDIEARAGEVRADLCLTARFRRLDLVRLVALIEGLA